MKLRRRQFLHLAAGAAVLPTVLRIAQAQTYPTRPVRLVVPFPGGGAADPIARLLANRLSEVWGQPMVIENKGGAAGNVGALAVSHSAPDGYTILFGTASLGTNRFIYSSLGYDPIGDFAPVTLLCIFPSLMVVPNSSPATSVIEFIDYAKATHGKIVYASPGRGLPSHLSGELFKRMTGIEMTHVPYRGSGPALNDLIPGRVDAMFGALPGLLPHVQGGTIRGLGVTSATRSPFAPSIPTIAESGLQGFDASAWYALFMPSKTPPEIVKKVHDDTVAALSYSPVTLKLNEISAQVVTSTPSELSAYLKSDMEKWGPIIKNAGIQPE
jgi:tripartite-type tricarboxylate transporter receptor subunit TctC